MKVPDSLHVVYKYALQMEHKESSLGQLLSKWTSNDYLNKIYKGQLLILVSPIFKLGTKILVHPTLDIDLGFNQSLIFVKKFFSNKKRQSLWYSEYTGKNGFHIYFKTLVFIEDPKDIIDIRNRIFLPLKKIIKYIDTVSSIRNVPTLRIGFRPDTGRTAIPLLKLDKQWIIKTSRHRGFDKTFDITLLKNYIENYIIPRTYIPESKYKTLAVI